MTKSTITREQLLEIIETDHVQCGEASYLARMALAAMDREPVAYMTYKGYLLHAGDPKLAEYSEPMPLYADPRPASTPAAPVAWDYEWASCITCEGPQNFNRVIEREAPPEWAVDEGRARNIIPLYRHAQPVVPDDVQRDAKRWRALLGSARIRILGSAGFDATAHPGENPDYRHFGMEIWTHYPNWLHEKNEYGIDTLTQYADAMLAAAPQEVKGE